jgi:hypothetical protein
MTHRHTPEEVNIQQRHCEIIKHPITVQKLHAEK